MGHSALAGPILLNPHFVGPCKWGFNKMGANMSPPTRSQESEPKLQNQGSSQHCLELDYVYGTTFKCIFQFGLNSKHKSVINSYHIRNCEFNFVLNKLIAEVDAMTFRSAPVCWLTCEPPRGPSFRVNLFMKIQIHGQERVLVHPPRISQKRLFLSDTRLSDI